MKVAVVSESEADEAGIRILVESIITTKIEWFAFPTRAGGWTQVFSLIPNIIPALYYSWPDVDGIVVVVDSDDSPSHRRAHELSEAYNHECRLCRLRVAVELALSKLRPLPDRDRSSLKVALGLAVPSIEAWYRAGLDSRVSENAWDRRLAGENVYYDRRSLKKDVYQSDQPSRPARLTAATAAGRRLGDNLELLETLFPGGFGSLLRELRNW